MGWYHSHTELDLDLTHQDIEFHLKLQTKFPNSVALVGSFGWTSDNKMVIFIYISSIHSPIMFLRSFAEDY